MTVCLVGLGIAVSERGFGGGAIQVRRAALAWAGYPCKYRRHVPNGMRPCGREDPMLVPVPLPNSFQKWLRNLTGFVRTVGELAEELARGKLEVARARRADRESVRQAVASAEALIPVLNALKFQEGGIMTTVDALLNRPSGKIWALFETEIKSGSRELDQLRKQIKDSAKLESRLGKELQLIREIATQKGGLFATTFADEGLSRYAHAGKPLGKEQRTALPSELHQTFGAVNAKISQAVERLNDFIAAERRE